MAWVLKMDEVIESGLVHDFDASLTGIGQELGAGAYSMRYGTPWAGRAGGRARASIPLGKGLQDPGPLPGAAAISGAPGLPGSGSGPAAWPPGPCSLAGLCPPRWRAWERGPATLGPGMAEGFIFCCKTRPAVTNDGLG